MVTRDPAIAASLSNKRENVRCEPVGFGPLSNLPSERARPRCRGIGAEALAWHGALELRDAR
jgi:hypothetical protein